MKRIDTSSLSCPEPVILCKKAMEEGHKELEVIADERVAVENISRLCKKMGYNISIEQENNTYKLFIKKDE